MNSEPPSSIAQATNQLSTWLKEDVVVHGIWGADTASACDVYRWIYSYPAWRVSTLQHWRDEGEWRCGTAQVVGLEASKIARLIMKGHGPTLQWLVGIHEGCDEFGEELMRVAEKAQTESSVKSRYSLANGWLQKVRKLY